MRNEVGYSPRDVAHSKILDFLNTEICVAANEFEFSDAFEKQTLKCQITIYKQLRSRWNHDDSGTVDELEESIFSA